MTAANETNPSISVPKKPKGFAAISPQRMREIASMGGKKAQALGKAHRYNAVEASAAGKKGGAKVAQKPNHMSDMGKKGGKARWADVTPEERSEFMSQIRKARAESK